MLANVVDLETEAMLRNCTEDKAAMVLFDFAAAIPSIAQAFII